MAGSAATITYDETGPIKKVLISWTSDDTTGAVTATTKKIVGYLLKGVTDPSATAPTNAYDVAITDEEGANVLGNCVDDLADRHNANTESVDFVIGAAGTYTTGARPCVCDKLTVAVTAAGNSKQGQIIIYWTPG